MGYAPMSASSSTRIPTSVPSRIDPISTNCTWARPCVRLSMLSLRDSCQRTGRPTICAARPTARYSGYTCSFAPNPPPTSGAMVRTRSFGTSSISARSERMSNGTCVDTHTVKPPSASGTTMMPFVSMGTGARRWFTNRPRTTTSAPASASVSQFISKACATLLPDSGQSSGAPSATAASTSVTAGSGSYIGTINSAASWARASVSATTMAMGSPTYRTTSLASTSRTKKGPSSVPDSPSTFPLGGWGGRPRSSASKTVTTPGSARAASTSTPESAAWGIMERANTARSAPSTAMFSRYRASPFKNLGSSDRRTGRPNIEGGTIVTTPC